VPFFALTALCGTPLLESVTVAPRIGDPSAVVTLPVTSAAEAAEQTPIKSTSAPQERENQTHRR
jgi:hypothetical protein